MNGLLPTNWKQLGDAIIAERIRELAAADKLHARICADTIVCELLIELGYKETARDFKALPGQYA